MLFGHVFYLIKNRQLNLPADKENLRGFYALFRIFERQAV
ncbi:hypothetical protein HMPREF9120_00753 [Neisseria sp. oral taxon 020 str. F0370]|nr:hypothetical protein HMPREF9120_00753 [Neisseria sp. oral taxon 020 str. F0370]